MNRFLSHPIFLWGSRWLLGAVFLVAAWYKITDLVDFAQNISYYDMIPLALLPAFAILLAGIEVSTGLALVTGLWRKGTALVVSLMLVMFIIAIAAAYIRGLSIDCGCFTADMTAEKAEDIRSHMLERLVQDVGLLALSLNLLFREGRNSGN